MATQALTGVGATAALGTLTPRISIALTGVGATVRQGFLDKSNRPGESFTLAYPTLAFELTGTSGGVGTLAIQEPLPAFTMTGTTATSGRVALAVPRAGLVLTGVTGAAGHLTLTTPRLQLALNSGAGLDIELPLPQLSMRGTTGVLGQLALRTPRPAITFTGSNPVVGTLNLATRAPRLSLSGDQGRQGQIGITALLPALTMQGVTGRIGTLTITLPAPEAVFRGVLASIGVLTIGVPAPRLALVATAPLAAPADVAAGLTTVVLQTERLAISQYTNFPFNSFAVFAGRHLGASSSGIFSLTGDDDAGVPIEAFARVGISDFNTSQIKRVTRIYVGYRTTGAMRMRVWTDESQQREYAVPPALASSLHGSHVRMGMGVDARYWQWELRNHRGADFSLDMVELKPTPLGRRVGVKDA